MVWWSQDNPLHSQGFGYSAYAVVFLSPLMLLGDVKVLSSTTLFLVVVGYKIVLQVPNQFIFSSHPIHLIRYHYLRWVAIMQGIKLCQQVLSNSIVNSQDSEATYPDLEIVSDYNYESYC